MRACAVGSVIVGAIHVPVSLLSRRQSGKLADAAEIVAAVTHLGMCRPGGVSLRCATPVALQGMVVHLCKFPRSHSKGFCGILSHKISFAPSPKSFQMKEAKIGRKPDCAPLLPLVDGVLHAGVALQPRRLVGHRACKCAGCESKVWSIDASTCVSAVQRHAIHTLSAE